MKRTCVLCSEMVSGDNLLIGLYNQFYVSRLFEKVQ